VNEVYEYGIHIFVYDVCVYVCTMFSVCMVRTFNEIQTEVEIRAAIFAIEWKVNGRLRAIDEISSPFNHTIKLICSSL
jgi:hypothetical protein